MKTAKPHLFIRLVERLSERAFKTAVTAGPVMGGLAVGMLYSAGQGTRPSDTPDDDFPDLADVTNLNWEATYGHVSERH
ncbi:MAG: hypothetical protein ACK40L_05905 [Hydrogenophaga sp.]